MMQETCHGLTRVIVSLAENHTKLIVDLVLSEDEQVRTRIMAFLHLVLVRQFTSSFFFSFVGTESQNQH